MKTDPSSARQTPSPRSRRQTTWLDAVVSFRWPLTVLAVAAVMSLTAYLSLQRSIRVAESATRAATRGALDIAEKFRSGKITTTFLAAIPEISASGSGKLELASARMTETFSRSDERRILWDLVPLGTTVVEIRVPVTYRYHLLLDDPWRLQVSGPNCVVHAPAIRPSLPPAIHTHALQKRTEAGWLRFDAGAQMEELEKSITPTLVAYARQPSHLELVREQCRKTVARFVRSWLLQNDQWRGDRFRFITVLFPDEQTESPGSLGDLLPSLRLED